MPGDSSLVMSSIVSISARPLMPGIFWGVTPGCRSRGSLQQEPHLSLPNVGPLLMMLGLHMQLYQDHSQVEV